MPGDRFYHSKEWRTLRAIALHRDNYTCTVDGCLDRATTVDHIKRRRDGGSDSLNNLRSLCSLHDKQVKEMSNGNRAMNGKFKLVGCGLDGWPLARR